MVTPSRHPQARNLASGVAAALAMLGMVTSACDPPAHRKPVEMTPIGTVPSIVRTAEESDGGTTTTPNSGTPLPKEVNCTADDFEALDEALKQCESKMPRGGDVPSGLRDKLEVRVTSATPSITPGGRVDLTLSLKNKSSEPLPLYFTGDPSPRFEVETLDTKGFTMITEGDLSTES